MKFFSVKGLPVLGKLIIVGGMATVALAFAPSPASAQEPPAPVQLAPESAPMPPAEALMAAPAPAPAAKPAPEQASAPAAKPAPEQASAPPVPMPMPPSEMPAPAAMPPMTADPAHVPAAPGEGEGDKKPVKKAKAGKKGQDIPEEKGEIRPLPEKYLVVKKEHDADDFSARLTSARLALSQERYGAALELFNGLYAKEPKDKRVLIGRAVAMQSLGQNAEALAAYEEVLKNEPKNLEALTNMLGILNTQDRDSAIERLAQLQEVYPFNADIAAQLGAVYGAAGEYEQALKYLDMADTLRPGNPDILYNKAVAYDRMGKTQQAANIYRQLVRHAADGDAFTAGFPIEVVKKRLSSMR